MMMRDPTSRKVETSHFALNQLNPNIKNKKHETDRVEESSCIESKRLKTMIES